MTKEIDLDDIGDYIKALHCPIRWDIIKILKEKPKTSDQIFFTLKKANKLEKASTIQNETKRFRGLCFHANHRNLKKPTLYYHLRELENAGIIKGKKLIDEEGNKLKEKEWKLTVKTLTINLK